MVSSSGTFRGWSRNHRTRFSKSQYSKDSSIYCVVLGTIHVASLRTDAFGWSYNDIKVTYRGK